jgi:hypothetical protein
MKLPSEPPDRVAEAQAKEENTASLLSALEREDLESRLETARRRERRHLLWMVLGISPAAVVPALGLLREGSLGLLVLLAVLVTATQWVSWTRASKEAEALEEEMEQRQTRPRLPGSPDGGRPSFKSSSRGSPGPGGGTP